MIAGYHSAPHSIKRNLTLLNCPEVLNCLQLPRFLDPIES